MAITWREARTGTRVVWQHPVTKHRLPGTITWGSQYGLLCEVELDRPFQGTTTAHPQLQHLELTEAAHGGLDHESAGDTNHRQHPAA